MPHGKYPSTWPSLPQQTFVILCKSSSNLIDATCALLASAPLLAISHQALPGEIHPNDPNIFTPSHGFYGRCKAGESHWSTCTKFVGSQVATFQFKPCYIAILDLPNRSQLMSVDLANVETEMAYVNIVERHKSCTKRPTESALSSSIFDFFAF